MTNIKVHSCTLTMAIDDSFDWAMRPPSISLEAKTLTDNNIVRALIPIEWVRQESRLYLMVVHIDPLTPCPCVRC